MQAYRDGFTQNNQSGPVPRKVLQELTKDYLYFKLVACNSAFLFLIKAIKCNAPVVRQEGRLMLSEVN